MKFRFSLCLLFSVSVFLFSCESEDLETNSDLGIRNASAEEIFRSVILKNGKYTGEIEFLASRPLQSSNLKFENALVDYIVANNPNFLTHLKNEFISKDPQRILMALEDTREVLSKFGESQVAAKIAENYSEEYVVIEVVIDYTHTLAASIAYVLPTLPVAEQNDLMAEQFALSIAEAF